MAMSVHEPFALRGVVQLICEDGVVGLGESYGDLAFLDQVRKMLPELPGHDVFDLPALRRTVARALGEAVFADEHGLTGGFSVNKTIASVYSLFEVASVTPPPG
jgi:glucarate dehydratase